MKRLIRRFLQLPWPDRALLVEATAGLAFARVAVLLLPFGWVMRLCGTHMSETPGADVPEQLQSINRVAWAVYTMSRYTGWESNCLAQAITAQHMLRRRSIASTLYLGASISDPGALAAHAWLRCGSRLITGAQGHEEFTVVAKFAQN